MIARVALFLCCIVVVAAPAASAATRDAADPLVPQEWWRAVVHVDALTPPAAGVPVTIVDSGVEFSHQEFVGDANLFALNNQEPAPIGGVHGTAVASVIAAPVNGVGLVGIYPTAIIRTYDASLGDGTQLPSAEIARGIEVAAHTGRSVINLSLGSDQPDPAITAAIDDAVRLGSLVVAASGNSGDQGNPLSYPAADAHVFTVAATDQNDQPAAFSSESQYVDISAPGVGIPVATARDNSYAPESGTSFAAPIVAGAAAWLWTVRPDLDASQVAEILRESARDVFTPGYDTATGYGILDMAAALAAPTPLRDSAEPNDSAAAALTLTTTTRTSARTSGRVAAYEDPRDVLKVWLPAKKRLAVTATASAGVTLTLDTGGITASDAIANSTTNAATTSLTYTNRGAGRPAFLVVTPARGVRSTTYAASVSAK